MTDRTRLPLPEPVGVIVVGTMALRAFTATQLRAYSDAENAALRGELIRATNFEIDAGRIMRHEPMLNGFEDLWAIEAERDSLEKRVVKMSDTMKGMDAHEAGLAEAQAYLMARVKVLEDALQYAIKQVPELATVPGIRALQQKP